jgi:hypothetical protein
LVEGITDMYYRPGWVAFIVCAFGILVFFANIAEHERVLATAVAGALDCASSARLPE